MTREEAKTQAREYGRQMAKYITDEIKHIPDVNFIDKIYDHLSKN